MDHKYAEDGRWSFWRHKGHPVSREKTGRLEGERMSSGRKG